MQCLTPITLVRKTGARIGKEYKHTDVVPCGKCPSCLKRRAFSWVFRLKQELAVSTTSAFITLTYAPETVPLTEMGLRTLDKTDHQKFMKRLRKMHHTHFENEDKVRYYAVGEYGERDGRPHYHYIMFNVDKRINESTELYQHAIWKKGIVHVGTVTARSIAYVTGYMNKTAYTNPFADGDDRQKEWSCMSKGLGANYLTENRKKKWKKDLNPYMVIEDGKKVPIPRYYREKTFTDMEKLHLELSGKHFVENNPQFKDEKHRMDYIRNAFYQKKRKDRINRKGI